MRRTWIVAATTGTLALVALAVGVALWLRPNELAASGSPSPSASASGADAGPREIPWAFFSQLPPDGGPGRFVVQAGVFGEARPRVDIEVPWEVQTDLELARMPAVARPADGTVVFVADDGEASTIQRVAIAPGAVPEVMGAVDDAIWSIAAAPHGSVAYAAIVARGRPEADLGVVRVALDGSGAVEQFLPPVAAAPDNGVRLAAIAPFTVTLDISADGRYLARTTCRGVVGCASSIIEVSTGEARDLGGANQLADMGTDGIVVVDNCGRLGCFAQVLDVATGASVTLESATFDTTVTSADGRAVAVGIEPVDDGAVLVASDPETGDRTELLGVAGGHWMTLAIRSHLMPAIEGAVLVIEGAEVEGEPRHRYLLVPLDGGEVVELPPPPVRPIGRPVTTGRG
jgi:hypothetical protein